MSFAAAVDHLHALGLELAPDPRSTTPRRKFDLEHMRLLASALGNPQQRFPAVLIAGTNGKGSTAATLAAILAAAGYRTGLYTSPHLTRVTERIRVAQPATEPGAPGLASETGDIPPPIFLDIPEPDFARLYFQVDEAANRLVAAGRLPHRPSFFESLTALAFLYFAGERSDQATRPPVDIAILEVGLGGRLDATNIVCPILSIITDIALDHQEYLGPTIAAIAREKAGILRPNGTLITLPQHPEANQAIGEAAIALDVRGINAADFLPGRATLPTHNFTPTALRSGSGLQPAVTVTPTKGALAPQPAPSPKTVILSEPRTPPTSETVILSEPRSGESKDLRLLPPNHYDLTLDRQPLHVRSPLPGRHQQRNIALALAAAIELRNTKSYKIPTPAIEAGIAQTAWPGRLELLPPNLLLDVAHNPAGAWTLRAAIATLPEDLPRTLIFSCLRDKDLTEMAQILFPLFDQTGGRPPGHLILAPIDSPRAASLEDLLAAARKLDIPAHPAQNPAEALALARTLTPPTGLILATGSIYLIGALRHLALQPAP